MDFSRQLNHIRLKGRDQDGFVHGSVYHHTRSTALKQILKEEKSRVDILKNIQGFAGLSEEMLRCAAQNLDEMTFHKDEVIVRQGDIGDTFYIVDNGSVEVTSKINTHDPREEPTVLGTLSCHQYFGESSLLTTDPQPTTYTVSSTTAKLLFMRKIKFEELTAAHDSGRSHQDIFNKASIFQTMSAEHRGLVFERMTVAKYTEGTYICRKGTTGDVFFIITNGTCKVTNIEGDTKQATKFLRAGDFIGEMALLDSSLKRGANVIAASPVTCLTLVRPDFDPVTRDLRAVFMELPMLKDIGVRKRKEQRGSEKRRLTAMNERGEKRDDYRGIFMRLSRFMLDSLACSMYARLYRELAIRAARHDEAKGAADELYKPLLSYDAAIRSIRDRLTEILSREPSKRSAQEHQIVISLLKQKNSLRDKVCKGWQSLQFTDLCQLVYLTKCEPLEKIYELDMRGSSAFLILRGSVRLYSYDSSSGPKKRVLRTEEDLMSGEVFGETAFDGLRTRQTSAVALTPCDLLVVDVADFVGIVEGGSKKLSVDARFRFLSRLSMFKGWEQYRVVRIAQLLNQEDFTKGAVILSKGQVSHKLVFILHGRVNILSDLGSPHDILTYLTADDYLGESGYINTAFSIRLKVNVTECGYAVAHTRLDVLTLGEEHFGLFDLQTLTNLATAFKHRSRLRINRAVSLKLENKKKKVELVKMQQMRRASEAEEALLSLEELEKLRTLRKATLDAKLSSGDKQSTNPMTAPICGVDDIPAVLMTCLADPLLVANSGKSEIEKRTVDQQLKSMRRASAVVMAGSNMDMSCSLADFDASQYSGRTSPATSRPSSVRSTRSNTSGSVTARSSAVTVSQHGIRILPLIPGAYLAAVNDCKDIEKDKDQRPYTPTRTLRGSIRIPSSRSFYETLTASQAMIMPSQASTPRQSPFLHPLPTPQLHPNGGVVTSKQISGTHVGTSDTTVGKSTGYFKPNTSASAIGAWASSSSPSSPASGLGQKLGQIHLSSSASLLLGAASPSYELTRSTRPASQSAVRAGKATVGSYKGR